MTIDFMSDVFIAPDPLLGSVGMIVIYYQLFRDAFKGGWLDEIKRAKLVEFEALREENRTRVREVQELSIQGKKSPSARLIDGALVAFERFVQSPNDVTALTKRYQILRRFVREGRLAA
jgi:hypothetical protein